MSDTLKYAKIIEDDRICTTYYLREIENRRNCENYCYFRFGDDYYRSRNTNIIGIRKQVCLPGFGITENPFMANHRLPSGYLKKIVDQAVNYLLGNGVQFTEDEEQNIDDYFVDTFDEQMIDVAITAKKKGEAWLYAYKDNGKLMFTQIQPEQLTPVFNERNELEMMIRCYHQLGKDIMLVYDKETVKRYEKDGDSYNLIASYGHYQRISHFNGQLVEEEQLSFGVVPFIPLYNNREHLSDLYPIKPQIDVYDIIKSDFANNIDDMQDAFFTLKGFSGDTEHLEEFMKQLKEVKVVPVGDDGDVGIHQLQVPVEARETFLNRLNKDIHKDAMAVDTNDLMGGSITNVVIKAMYNDLDLKCDQFESELRKFIKSLVLFINAQDSKAYSYDVRFDRSAIMNATEMMEVLVKTVGSISKELFLNLLPFDIDVDKELKQQDKEREPYTLEVDVDE